MFKNINSGKIKKSKNDMKVIKTENQKTIPFLFSRFWCGYYFGRRISFLVFIALTLLNLYTIYLNGEIFNIFFGISISALLILIKADNVLYKKINEKDFNHYMVGEVQTKKNINKFLRKGLIIGIFVKLFEVFLIIEIFILFKNLILINKVSVFVFIILLSVLNTIISILKNKTLRKVMGLNVLNTLGNIVLNTTLTYMLIKINQSNEISLLVNPFINLIIGIIFFGIFYKTIYSELERNLEVINEENIKALENKNKKRIIVPQKEFLSIEKAMEISANQNPELRYNLEWAEREAKKERDKEKDKKRREEILANEKRKKAKNEEILFKRSNKETNNHKKDYSKKSKPKNKGLPRNKRNKKDRRNSNR